jgi:mannose-6-phosphate isomerase-like protein (cupin superfamily)
MPYDIHLDVKHPPLEAFDIAREAAAQQPWFNQTLVQVDEALVRLGVLEGDFHWHKHDDQDEFFLVLEGHLRIELEGRESVDLRPWQAVTVPKGLRHCPHALGRTVVVMIERAGVNPTGDWLNPEAAPAAAGPSGTR